MRLEGQRGQHLEGRHRGRRSEHIEGKTEGAKTFRRKRAIMFLEHLETKESILKKQLAIPELQSVNPIIIGELIIEEFVQQFELYEFEEYAKLRFSKDPEIDTNEVDKK